MGRMPEEMDAAKPVSASVQITAKRLDSDEVFETVTEVESVGSEAAIREQLNRLVMAGYPEAEFRSFADGAATYLAPKLLVVAVHFPAEHSPAEAGEDDESQQQLFAA